MTLHYSAFPNLRNATHRKTSEPASQENCIAHAAGARGEWWEPVLGRFWPIGPPFYNHRVESLVRVFERLGYVICDSSEHETSFEKLAIYADGGQYTHVARQLPDGTWTSKLGAEDDINHLTLESLEGGDYGRVVRILSRRIAARSESTCCEREGPAE